jgi:hypothetical protein
MAPKHRLDDRAKLAAAERFIEIAGSKREAHRLIDATQSTKGRSGRPKGSPNFAADAAVLFDVERLENEYRRAGGKVPKRRRLIKEVVSLNFDNLKLGKNEDAATARINLKPSLLEMMIGAIRLNRPDLAQHLPPDAEERARAMDPSSFSVMLEMLLALAAFQQKYPDAIARALKQAAAHDRDEKFDAVDRPKKI